MALTQAELKVLINIIGAVETGGQVYGQGRYNDFTEAYANVKTETAITIGKYQHYANEAKSLLLRIQKADPAMFAKYDTAGIAADLKKSSWSNYRISKSSSKAKCIVNIISSDVGKRVQDEMVGEQMQKFVAEAEALGVTDHQAQCMCANWRHQGGSGAVKRIIGKTKKPYNLDNLYNACKTDTGNQVGAYKTRQKLVYNWLKTYWPKDATSDKETIKESVSSDVKKETESKQSIDTSKTTETKKSGYNKTVKFVGKVTASSLSLRTEPNSKSSRLKSYPYVKKNTKLNVCDEVINSNKEKWYYIQYKGKYGFASAGWIAKL